MTEYTPPSGDAVDFLLAPYVRPGGDEVDFNIADVTASEFLLSLLPDGYWPLGDLSGNFLDHSGNGNDFVLGGLNNITRGHAALDVAGDGGLQINGTTLADAGSPSVLDDIFDSGGALCYLFYRDPVTGGGSIIFRQGTGSDVIESGSGWQFINQPTHFDFRATFSTSRGRWTAENVIVSGEIHPVWLLYDSSSAANDPTIIIYNPTNGFQVLTVGDGIVEQQTPAGDYVSGASEDLSLLSVGNSVHRVVDEIAAFNGHQPVQQDIEEYISKVYTAPAPILEATAVVEIHAEGAISKAVELGATAVVEIDAQGAVSKQLTAGATAVVEVHTDAGELVRVMPAATALVEVHTQAPSTPAKQTVVGATSEIQIAAQGILAKRVVLGAQAAIEIYSLASEILIDPVIFDVHPHIFEVGRTVVITGSNLGSLVELSDSPVYGEGTLVEQEVLEASNSEITFSVVQGSLAQGPLYLYVTLNPTSDPFPVYLIPNYPLPPLFLPSPEQVIEYGLSESTSRRFKWNRVLANNVVIDDISDAVIVSGATLHCNNDAAVPMYIQGLALLKSNLPSDFNVTNDIIRMTEERLIDGSWVEFPQGMYRLTVSRTIYNVFDETVIECDAYDLSMALVESGPAQSYTVPSGTNYASLVFDVLSNLGLFSVLDAVSETTPHIRTWPPFPETNWWQIIHEASDGINYHTPWPNIENGRFIWMPKPIIMSDVIENVVYRNTQEPKLIVAKDYIVTQELGILGNHSYVDISNPNHPQFPLTVHSQNNDPASPVSTTVRPIKVIDIDWDSTPTSSAMIYDIDAAQDMADMVLRLEAAKFETVSLTTVADPRRRPHEYYRLDIQGIENSTLWRVQSWSRQLSGTEQVHILQRVRSVAIDRFIEDNYGSS